MSSSGRGSSSNRMAPPPVPSLQPGQHQEPSPTSSGIQHQQHQNHHQPEYIAVPGGSRDERCSRCRRVDDGQSPSGLSVAPQQHRMAGYPAQQYHTPAPARWYGSGAQPTNAPTSQPPQPPYGYSPTSAGPIYTQHGNPSHAPTRNLSMYAVQIPTAPSRSGSTQGQGQYYYSGAATYSQPTQAYQQPPSTPTHATGMYQVHTPAGSSGSSSVLTAHPTTPMVGYSAAAPAIGFQVLHRAGNGRNPTDTGPTAPVMDLITDVSDGKRFASELPPNLPTLATPGGMLSLGDGPSSHVPPFLTQANPTASGGAPNSGAAPGGSNATASGTSTIIEPTSLNQHIGPSRSDRTNSGRLSKPYQRPTPAVRKTRPITYEGNLDRLQQRCRRQGADEGAVGLLGKVFANEVSLEALTRQLTDAEVHTKEFGVETRRIYVVFLETINEEEGVVPRYACRLCHTERIWKHHKYVLRHLRRDHFGLPEVCEQCDKKFYTKGEMTRHPCK